MQDFKGEEKREQKKTEDKESDKKMEKAGQKKEKSPAAYLSCRGKHMSACNPCIGIGYVAWEIAGGECFARGVAPSAGKGIVCADEFEVGAGGEVGQAAAAIEHVDHLRHLRSIQRG